MSRVCLYTSDCCVMFVSLQSFIKVRKLKITAKLIMKTLHTVQCDRKDSIYSSMRDVKRLMFQYEASVLF